MSVRSSPLKRTVTRAPNPKRLLFRANESDRKAISGSAFVVMNGRRAPKVVHHDVEVAIAVEVRECRAETHTILSEAPGSAGFFHGQVAFISESAIGLFQGWLGIPEVVVAIPTVFGRSFGAEVAIEPIAAHAVGDEEIF